MWRERRVPAGSASFHVRELGDGDDLVLLLHGWPQDGHAWRLVAPELVAAGFRVAAPDLRGFGRSVGDGGHDPETLADELAQLISALGVRRAVVVGHDFGGAVGLATAFRHPGRVSGLVLVSSPYREIDLRRGWLVPVMNLPVLPQVAFRVAPRPLVRAAMALSVSRRSAYGAPDIEVYARAVQAQPRAWLGYPRRLSRKAVAATVARTVRERVPFLPDPAPAPRLRPPVAVLWGGRDPVAPMSLAVRTAGDLGAPLVVAERAGHMVPEESPHAVVDVVRRLVAGDLVEGTEVRRGA